MAVLVKIISGGQTGVDRAALDAAMRLRIPHGGWCPRGRLAEDGAIPPRYKLRQTGTRHYARRTEKNVLDSDATLILCRSEPAGGTLLTLKLAEKHDKPCLVLDLDSVGSDRRRLMKLNKIRRWLAEHSVKKLNVAGPRESQAPGIHKQSFDLLAELFQSTLCPQRPR